MKSKIKIKGDYSIRSLRKKGWKIRIIHYRNNIITNKWEPRISMNRNPKEISPCGGITEMEVTTPTGENLFGSNKIPRNQPFIRRVNNHIVLGRILQKFRAVSKGSAVIESVISNKESIYA